MDVSKCRIHGPRPLKTVIAHGHFVKVNPEYCWGRLTMEGEEFEAGIAKNKIIASKGEELDNRFFAITRSGGIHLCKCLYTQEDIDIADKKAKSLGELLAKNAKHLRFAED